ncbi:hypothetical protein EST38_g5599 [Candolleomyces aberdarensis]|uniref:F-box domain-containing protein n=1 Tax=Candolleomyces aberdarensis TaxID=2316362 RepID=A0A4Q2DNA9_9AGAR|nr:hypothetical protein EST38_g5599 [Candolleomyces aberdarensis]
MDMGNKPQRSGSQIKRARASDTSSTGSLGVPTFSPGNGKQRASFDFFKDSPLDILREVLDYLSPLDLLHLSRTSKALRAFFMNKISSPAIWRSALAAVNGLPPCPEDLAEPQYANLLFGNHCHLCLVEHDYVSKYMEARVRLCQTCGVYEFLPWDKLSGKIDERLKSLIPCIVASPSRHEQEIKHITCDSFNQNSTRKQYFHVVTAIKLNKELEALGSHEKMKTSWLENRGAVWNRMREHSDACRNHASMMFETEQARVSQARNCRKQQLREKIAGLGWGSEFDRMDRANAQTRNANLCCVGYLRRTEDLTEQEWEETKPDWLIFMEAIRNITERSARAQRFEALVRTQIVPFYSRYVLSQPSKALTPTLAEVVLMEELLPILGNHVLSQVPQDPDGIFDNVFGRFPELLAKWNSEREEVLMQALRKSTVYECKDIPEGVLSYASTVFSCRECGDVLTYPTVFVHECFLRLTCPDPARLISKKTRRWKQEVEFSALGGVLAQEALDEIAHDVFRDARSWQPGSNLVFHDPGYHHTVVVLDLLGLERTTTSEELRQIDPYLECRCECFKRSKSETMGWMEALMHCKGSHSYGGSFAIVDKRGGPTETWQQIQVYMYKSLCPLCQQWQNDPREDVIRHYGEHGCSEAGAQAFDSRAWKEEMDFAQWIVDPAFE